MNREKTQKLWELLSDDKLACLLIKKEDFIGMKKIVCIGINTFKLWDNSLNHKVQLLSETNRPYQSSWEYKSIDFKNKAKAKKFMNFINKEKQPFKLEL